MKKLFIVFLFIVFGGCNIALVNGAESIVSSAPTQANVAGASSLKPVLSNPLQIFQPNANAKIPAGPTTFVCGSAPADGKLSINGQPVTIHPDGGFTAMVNLTPGEFTIKAELVWRDTTYQLTRIVKVAAPEESAPVTPLTIEYITPGQELELQPGDTVTVVCKGSPGMKAFFKISGVRGQFSMVETDNPVPGIYRGVYQVKVKDRLRKSHLKVTLVNSQKQKITKAAEGVLSLFSRDLPAMAEVSASDVVLRSGPALGPDDKAGYMMFPPQGTLLQLTGKIGNEYRVRLNDTQTAWVNTEQVKRLPQGTPLPCVAVGNLAFARAENAVQLRIPLGVHVPFRIDVDSEGRYLDLTLFGVYSNTDRIMNMVKEIIKQVSWFQDDRETYRLRINTVENSWWGYDIRYEGRELVLELRTPPPVTEGNNPLTGLLIAVDAGHGSQNGAIGCTGYAEGSANLAIALQLREKLLARGAKVIMTRPAVLDVPLSERTNMASRQHADLLISVHNNSLGYGGNPLQKHGYEIYYFTPMSYWLAWEIHGAYGETFGPGRQFELPDGGLYYGNLALARGTQMPSVLVESAYMIYPVEEAWLKTGEFQGACADAMISGLERFAGRMRKVVRQE